MDGADTLSFFIEKGGRGDQKKAAQPLHIQLLGILAAILYCSRMGAEQRRTGCPMNSFITVEPDALLGFEPQMPRHCFVDPQDSVLVVADRDQVRHTGEGPFPLFLGASQRFLGQFAQGDVADEL
jgi:hypothetical protein